MDSRSRQSVTSTSYTAAATFDPIAGPATRLSVQADNGALIGQVRPAGRPWKPWSVEFRLGPGFSSIPLEPFEALRFRLESAGTVTMDWRAA